VRGEKGKFSVGAAAIGMERSVHRRRSVLHGVGQLAGVALLAACGEQPQAIVVTPASTPGTQGGQPTAGASVAAPVGPGKPMYQMDPQHTGRSPYVGPSRAVLARSLDASQPEFLPPENPASRTDFQSGPMVAPDGTIYISTFAGMLMALRDAGAQLGVLWKFHPPGAATYHGSPALGRDGTVYAAFASGTGAEAKNTLYAVRAPTSGGEGQVAWTADLGLGQAMPGGTGNSPTVAADGTIYALGGGGQLTAVGPDGSLKWTAQAGPATYVSPALARDGTVYVASQDGNLYAIAPPAAGSKEGARRWTFDFGQHPGATPLVTAPVTGGGNRGQDGVGSAASATIGPDGTIYIGANNSNFYAVAPDGKLKWLYEAERELAGIWTTAVLSEDNATLYFGANKGGVYALNAADGKLKWQSKIGGSIYASPTLDSRGKLYVGTTIGHLLAITASTGQWLFDYDAGTPLWAAPAIRPDGSLVTAGRNGRVMVFAA
jgi:outer membrane protein assembly factor BamB